MRRRTVPSSSAYLKNGKNSSGPSLPLLSSSSSSLSSSLLRRGVLFHDALHLLLVRLAVLLEQVERVGLGGGLRVRLVEQRLDAEQDLLDGDGGLPALFFVEDGEADGARGVDVWVEERGGEFALWGLGWVLCAGVLAGGFFFFSGGGREARGGGGVVERGKGEVCTHHRER